MDPQLYAGAQTAAGRAFHPDEMAKQRAYAEQAGTLAPAPPPPLTDRIEALLNEASNIAGLTVAKQSSCIGRLFGHPPQGTGIGPATPESSVFEDRVFSRLQGLLSLLAEAHSQADTLNCRI